MTRAKILVVEDEEDIQELIKYNLNREGFETQGVFSGENALDQIKKDPPDLVILDLMLPGMNGLDVCRTLKSKESTSNIPVVMVTARGEEADIVLGLELGAEDYITKPFSPRVLVARIRTVLRRISEKNKDNDIIRIHGLVIDAARHSVANGDLAVDLTATEFSVLNFLARHTGRVFTRGQIIDSVKGEYYAVTERSVDVQIVGIRKKLGKAGNLIETVRGVGYRFKE